MRKRTPIDPRVIPWPGTQFAVGQPYTREQIQVVLGGDRSSDFPHRDGRVVCGCFRPDLSPDAPDVVLPRRGPASERWARVFATQDGFIPCFLRNEAHAWEYVGCFCVRRLISDPAERKERAKGASRPAQDVSLVLYLRDH